MRLAAGLFVVLAAVSSGVASADTPPADITAKLHSFYGTRDGYAEVTRDVMKWHKTALNGCVAFASTALRHIGVDIPQDGKIDGQGVSRITRSFSLYLSDTLGWTRVTDMTELKPGDIAFTTDAPCCEGYPNHVMMFDGWSDKKRKIALVVDNQGFHVARGLIQPKGSDVDGFAYALRPPVKKS